MQCYVKTFALAAGIALLAGASAQAQSCADVGRAHMDRLLATSREMKSGATPGSPAHEAQSRSNCRTLQRMHAINLRMARDLNARRCLAQPATVKPPAEELRANCARFGIRF